MRKQKMTITVYGEDRKLIPTEIIVRDGLIILNNCVISAQWPIKQTGIRFTSFKGTLKLAFEAIKPVTGCYQSFYIPQSYGVRLYAMLDDHRALLDIMVFEEDGSLAE